MADHLVNQLNLAQAAQARGDFADALARYQALAFALPKNMDLQAQCGNLCVQLAQFEEAAGYFRRVARVIRAHDIERKQSALNALCYALNQFGNAQQQQGRFAQAALCFEEALEYQPNNAVFWYNLGNAQRELGQPEKAFFAFSKALSIEPNDADFHNNLGNVLRELGRLDEAILAYAQALKIDPNMHHARAHWVHQKQHCCDWQDLAIEIERLILAIENAAIENADTENIATEKTSAQISPFAFLAMPGTSAATQLKCASLWANQAVGKQTLPGKPQKIASNKIKLGYLSADFRQHPLASLITEVIAAHNRTEFEIIAYAQGKNDGSAARRAFERTFDSWVDISAMTDSQAAEKMRADEIDILIDLTGYTQQSRSLIAAHRPASAHINWLGYPGSMGFCGNKPLFDYLIADEILIPSTEAPFYAEKIVYLPCYQPNNAQRDCGKPSEKSAHHLPKEAFVFCCFNQSFKISAEIFGSWLRILQATPQSVLWLLECNRWAKTNLLAAAQKAGIASSRIVFAPRMAAEAHLERHHHADLFLDTLPYNAHTTASDALLMGLPVLTLVGETFPSRVSASLLNALQMPNLICANLAQYETQAILLAHQPAQLAAIKTKLKLAKTQSGVFKPAEFASNLEKALLNILQQNN